MGHEYFVVVPQVVPHVTRYISVPYNLGAQEAQLFMLVKYSKRGYVIGTLLYCTMGKDVPHVPLIVVSRCPIWAYLWGTTKNRRAPKKL